MDLRIKQIVLEPELIANAMKALQALRSQLREQPQLN
jgi:hypothetical protein